MGWKPASSPLSPEVPGSISSCVPPSAGHTEQSPGADLKGLLHPHYQNNAESHECLFCSAQHRTHKHFLTLLCFPSCLFFSQRSSEHREASKNNSWGACSAVATTRQGPQMKEKKTGEVVGWPAGRLGTTVAAGSAPGSQTLRVGSSCCACRIPAG